MTSTTIAHFELVFSVFEQVDPFDIEWCDGCNEKRSKWGCNNFGCCCPYDLNEKIK